ncbi:MAG: peptidase S41 [Ruminococcus sp.]|nr:peptidase S41 [Ruminococcus sp.]
MNNYDLALMGAELLFCLLLWLLAGYAERVLSTKFRLLYLVPAVVCLLLTLMVGPELCMAGAYIGSVGLAFGFFRDEKKLRRISSVICAAVIAVSLPVCLLDGDYRNRPDYIGDFEKAYASISKHYALTKHKQIDWIELYKKYRPQFAKVTKTRDKYENQLIWQRFCAELYDGHVNYAPNKGGEEFGKEVKRRYLGNDYGLVIMHTSDDGYAALCVDDSLNNLGIHNGTRVISWNGETPDEADKHSEMYDCRPFFDKENEDFYKGMLAAGTGGETAELRYIADDGSEQTVTLPKLSDNYSERYKDFSEKIHKGHEAAHLSVTKVNDTTACLRIKFMAYDSQSSQNDDHIGMKSEIRDKVTALMDEGVKDLVIDCRSNSGGSGDMVKGIASLFAPEGEHYYCTNPVWDEDKACYPTDENGDYLCGEEITFTGENILGSGKIILLVNDECASAGDHITKVMRGMENVTVMGFTKPAGVGQGVYGIELENGSLSYSSAVMLDRDGSIYIDAGVDKLSTDDIDIKVPFDDGAIHAIFDEDEDYLLDLALEKLSQ